jgi:ribonuclease HI
MRPVNGIAVDAAHSQLKEKTEYQGIDISTGEQLFYADLGFKTVNIGEFLAIVEAIKYILRTDFQPRVIYSDSLTAISWIKNRSTASRFKDKALPKACIFLKAYATEIETITILHWNNQEWGETPADFGNK